MGLGVVLLFGCYATGTIGVRVVFTISAPRIDDGVPPLASIVLPAIIASIDVLALADVFAISARGMLMRTISPMFELNVSTALLDAVMVSPPFFCEAWLYHFRLKSILSIVSDSRRISFLHRLARKVLI